MARHSIVATEPAVTEGMHVATCSVDGCVVKACRRGKCERHYRLQRRRERSLNPRKCSVDGCDGSVRVDAAGLCNAHYLRLRRYGSPKIRKKLPNGTTKDWLQAHVGYTGEGCLTWPFYTRQEGVAYMTFRGKPVAAARVMCVLAHGEPPTIAHEAAHSCGNGHLGCVHPQHLRWATHKENGADMQRHGSLAGEKSGKAKLTALAIRSIRLDQRPDGLIANDYGVTASCIRLIKRRQRWAHVPD